MAGRSPDDADESALLLTGDGRYVEVAATLQFAIDPADPDAVTAIRFRRRGWRGRA